MTYYVYLLECSDGSYYVGVTNDLTRRTYEHQEGIDTECYTYTKRPVILKYYLIYDYINDAINAEKRIKRWSRAKKEAFFKKDWKTMHAKAKCKNSSSHENQKENSRSSEVET